MKIELLKVKERSYLLKALEEVHGDLDRAAHLLQITPLQLKKKIKAHGLRVPGAPEHRDRQPLNAEKEDEP